MSITKTRQTVRINQAEPSVFILKESESISISLLLMIAFHVIIQRVISVYYRITGAHGTAMVLEDKSSHPD